MNINEMITYHKDLSSKLEGFCSLNTSTTHNKYCKIHAANNNSVCSKCYALRTEKRFSKLEEKNKKNLKKLTKNLIEFKGFLNVAYMRFHAFGELENLVHLDNFIRITKKYKRTTFSLYTKRIDLLKTYFTTHKKPKNLIIVVSSPIINIEINLKSLKKQLPVVDKVFTVYSKEYAIANNILINCGGKKCSDCLICYKKSKSDKNNIIRELIK